MLVALFCEVHYTSVDLPVVSKSCARTHNQRRRIEKMLRRRALILNWSQGTK